MYHSRHFFLSLLTLAVLAIALTSCREAGSKYNDSSTSYPLPDNASVTSKEAMPAKSPLFQYYDSLLLHEPRTFLDSLDRSSDTSEESIRAYVDHILKKAENMDTSALRRYFNFSSRLDASLSEMYQAGDWDTASPLFRIFSNNIKAGIEEAQRNKAFFESLSGCADWTAPQELTIFESEVLKKVRSEPTLYNGLDKQLLWKWYSRKADCVKENNQLNGLTSPSQIMDSVAFFLYLGQ